MVTRYMEYTLYYEKHATSRMGAILTTLMLSVLLVLFILGRATLDMTKINIPKEKKTTIVAMRVHTVSPTEQVLVAKNVIVNKKKAITNKKAKDIPKIEQQRTTSSKVAPLPNKVHSNASVEEEVNIAEKQSTQNTSPAIPETRVVENNPTEVQKVVSSLVDSIEQYKTYPRIARRAGYEGVVNVSITVNAEGKVLSYAVQESSGFSVLDASARKILEQIKKQMFTSGVLLQDITVVIPIRYNLQ